MWTVSRMVCMGLLAGLSLADIYKRRIPLKCLIIGSLLAVGYQIFIGRGDIIMILGGIGVGMSFLLISRITRESLGYGDSLAILILGIYLGLWELLMVLAGAFFLLAVFSVAGLTARKMSRKLSIPFFPFLSAGYLMSVLR